MKKQLLIITFAATLSGLTFAAETPHYEKLPIDLQQFCTAYNTETCKELAALLITGQELFDEHGVVDEKLAELHHKLAQEIAQHQEIGIKKDEKPEDI